jgi:hypothetical protein
MMTRNNNSNIRRFIERVMRRVVVERDDVSIAMNSNDSGSGDVLDLTSSRAVIDASRVELPDEWHDAHVLSADDMQLATHSIYDAIVDHYYLDDELTTEQLDRLYNAIFNKLDAEHKNYIGYDE